MGLSIYNMDGTRKALSQRRDASGWRHTFLVLFDQKSVFFSGFQSELSEMKYFDLPPIPDLDGDDQGAPEFLMAASRSSMYSYFTMHFRCMIDTLFPFLCSIDSVCVTSTHARIQEFFVTTSMTDPDFLMLMECSFRLN